MPPAHAPPAAAAEAPWHPSVVRGPLVAELGAHEAELEYRVPLVRCAALHSSDPPGVGASPPPMPVQLLSAPLGVDQSTLGFLNQLQFVKTANSGRFGEVKGPGSMIGVGIQGGGAAASREAVLVPASNHPACTHPPPFLPLLPTGPQPRAVVHCLRALYPAAGGLPDMLFWLGIAIVALVVWKLLDDNR